MTPEDAKALEEARIAQAREALDDAKFCFAQQRSGALVVNRAYYAAFYAALALLSRLGKTPKSHQGVLSLLASEVVRPGLVADAELTRLFRALFIKRLEDDYRVTGPVSRQDQTDQIADAEKFMELVNSVLKNR